MSELISLEKEAKVCSELLKKIRDLGARVPTNHDAYVSTVEEFKRVLSQLYETTRLCSDIPEEWKEKRSERIKGAMRFSEKIVSEEDITQWTFHLSPLRAQTLNLCMAPIYMSRIYKTNAWLRNFRIRGIQRELLSDSLSYASSYEKRKILEIEERARKGEEVNPRIMISKAKYHASPFGQGKIVYSFSQFIEPSIILLNQPLNKIEEIKKRISSLALMPDVKSLLLNNIRKYRIEEVYPGPYILTLIESRKEEMTQVLREYISRIPAARKRLCNPVFIWQFFFDAIFYDKKMQVLDCYLIPLGYKKEETKVEQEKLPYVS